MTVTQMYSQFGTPKNLQLHMLRVTALASIVLDSWIGPEIDKQSIQTACLFHDIAKPITFDMSKQRLFVESKEELTSLQKHHDRLITKYGTDEHEALSKIFRELGLSESSERIVNNLQWSLSDELIAKNIIESLVPIYADMRISPKGVLTIRQRLLELHQRAPIQNFGERLMSAESLEKVLAKNTTTNLDKISNDQVNAQANKLKTLELNSTF